MCRLPRPILALAGTAVVALGPQTATAQQSAMAETARPHLVVFIRPGPEWAGRAAAVPALVEHRDIYRRLDERRAIIVSGPFEGEPVLGMAVFDQNVDQAEIRRLLDADPAVTAGILANEFRHFTIHFGALTTDSR